MINDSLEDGRLVLAAEEFPEDQFEKFHTFSDYEERIIRSLIAHGPVLLRGSRGRGKSALLKPLRARCLWKASLRFWDAQLQVM